MMDLRKTKAREDDEGKVEEHQHRVLGGYKAALHNDHSSTGAREHAAEILVDHNVPLKHDEIPPAYASETHTYGHPGEHHNSHFHHLDAPGGKGHSADAVASHRAILHNRHASEEAKKDAEKWLQDHGEKV